MVSLAEFFRIQILQIVHFLELGQGKALAYHYAGARESNSPLSSF